MPRLLESQEPVTGVKRHNRSRLPGKFFSNSNAPARPTTKNNLANYNYQQKCKKRNVPMKKNYSSQFDKRKSTDS